jgi:hypothetical protein
MILDHSNLFLLEFILKHECFNIKGEKTGKETLIMCERFSEAEKYKLTDFMHSLQLFPPSWILISSFFGTFVYNLGSMVAFPLRKHIRMRLKLYI